MVFRLSLADFVEEELLRAPLTFDAVIDAVHDQWRDNLVVQGRDGGALTRMLQMQRGAFMDAALRSLRLATQKCVQDVVRPQRARNAQSGSAGSAEWGAKAASTQRMELKLVEESDVVADLSIRRCGEHIASQADAELRELHAYTSALVGDRDVSRQTNPLQPEYFARSLWDGAQALPTLPAVRADFFRRATPVMAQALQASFGAACARLSAEGVTPAVHRTVIPAPGSAPGLASLPEPDPFAADTVPGALHAGSETGPTPARAHLPPQSLNLLRDSLPGKLDGPTTQGMDFDTTTQPAGLNPSAAPQSGAAPNGDPQLAELLSRLYPHIAKDDGLPADVGELLARLCPTVDRIALQDGAMADGFEHPVWRFMDSLAFIAETTPPPERRRMLGLARNLVDNLAGDSAADAARFSWATEKLEAQDRLSLTLATRAAAPDILRLAQTDAAAAPAALAEAGEQVALDYGSLDTVPASIWGDTSSSAEQPPLTLAGARPGDRLRVFLQGEWRALQLLWSRDDMWLLRDLAGGRQWALRPGAIERLIAERLALPLRMRSLARRAAERVQDDL